jgi:Tfp pilus assembly protein PilP
MKKILFPFLIMLLVSGCSSNVPEEKKLEPKEDDQVEVVTKEVEARAPIFTYGEKETKISIPQEIELTFNSEPVFIGGQGYMRLTGILGEKDPLAIIEIGGTGLQVKAGESIGGYTVRSIEEGKVKLKRKVNGGV